MSRFSFISREFGVIQEHVSLHEPSIIQSMQALLSICMRATYGSGGNEDGGRDKG